jgi:hypothetical protein
VALNVHEPAPADRVKEQTGPSFEWMVTVPVGVPGTEDTVTAKVSEVSPP